MPAFRKHRFFQQPLLETCLSIVAESGTLLIMSEISYLASKNRLEIKASDCGHLARAKWPNLRDFTISE